MYRPSLEMLEKRDLLSAGPLAANFRDDLIGWDFVSRTIDHDETTHRMAPGAYAQKNQDIEVENDETHWLRTWADPFRQSNRVI
jgi:hypothetical protein